MLDGLSGYELTLLETTDDAEMFVFWREQKLKNENVWARSVPSDLNVHLFDRGVRSVKAVAALKPSAKVLAVIPVAEWREALIDAAKAWAPLPDGWRKAVAGTYGLRVPVVEAEAKKGEKVSG